MDFMDLGSLEGCYADNSLNPLHIRTLETTYIRQIPLGDHPHKSDALDRHSPTSGISSYTPLMGIAPLWKFT
jgi:hypothetical protein